MTIFSFHDSVDKNWGLVLEAHGRGFLDHMIQAIAPFASKTPDRAAPDKPPSLDSKTSLATLMDLSCSLAIAFLLHTSRGEKCAKIRPPIPSSLKVAVIYSLFLVPDKDNTPRLTDQKGRDGAVQTEEGVRECSSWFLRRLPVSTCHKMLFLYECQPEGALTCSAVFAVGPWNRAGTSGTDIILKGRLWIADKVGMRDCVWIFIPMPCFLLGRAACLPKTGRW